MDSEIGWPSGIIDTLSIVPVPILASPLTGD
jgi:hypothetical protein